MGSKQITCQVNFIFAFFHLSLWISGSSLYGQQITVVKGIVTDDRTNDPLPFASVAFSGTSVGATTDMEGAFELSVDMPVDSIVISYLGYESRVLAISRGKSQQLKISLKAEATVLATVNVRAEKERYRRKGNPALALIKKVIEHKNDNRLESLGHYAFRKYEKVELDINNLSEKFIGNPALRKIDFIFDYLDTTDNGEALLPIFFQETSSRVYYRKDPESKKEHREALKVTNIDDETTSESLYNLTKQLYQTLDIYQDRVFLFNREFVSPLAPIAPGFYHFYITDTTEFKGRKVVNLAFVPGNKYNPGFDGTLYVTLDSSYQVIGLKMGLLGTVNLNFIDNVKMHQEFELQDSVSVVVRDELKADFELADKLIGITGQKTTVFHDYDFTPYTVPEVYEGSGNLIVIDGDDERSEAYWQEIRPEPLTEKEAAIYSMVDTLKSVPMIRMAVSSVKALSMGYVSAGPVDIGSVLSFISYNDVEGWRFKFGGKTNEQFHKQLRLESYAAYGTRDQRVKFSVGARYAFEKEYRPFPAHYLAVNFTRDNKFPGAFSYLASSDNFFLSFRTGLANKMLAYDMIQIDYYKRFANNFSFNVILEREKQEAAGAWSFDYYNEATDQFDTQKEISTLETSLVLQYAPNAEYFEGAHLRYNLLNRYPILDLAYTRGWDGLLGGKYSYDRLDLGVSKRFFLSAVGYTDVYFSGGKVWGQRTPYVLLHIPRANQSYTFQPKAYNVMNFMEFSTDQYLSLFLNHNFNGFILNKIPLIRQLKLRSLVGFKALYGRLSDVNNPELDPTLIQYSANEDGVPETYSVGDQPYLEFSVGVTNILKFFRLDYVRRLNYLNHPNIPSLFGIKGSGLRIGIEFQF